MEANPSIFKMYLICIDQKTFSLEVPYLFHVHSQSTCNKGSGPEPDFAGVMWSLQTQGLSHDTVL